MPNSAFQTFFGKPAFENYGYGNVKPSYGGIFYGNYMLSHNINPVDGMNNPDTKQVYSSSMLAALNKQDTRYPKPPRKVPEEIRNTPAELKEIKSRCPIFQYPNEYPARDIEAPNLLKEQYFCSNKGTPAGSEAQSSDGDYIFNINDVVNDKGTKRRKKKTPNTSSAMGIYNPFKQGKVELEKKKNKARLDMKGVLKENSKKVRSERNETNRSRQSNFDQKNLRVSEEMQIGPEEEEEEEFEEEEEIEEEEEEECKVYSEEPRTRKIKVSKENPALGEPENIE